MSYGAADSVVCVMPLTLEARKESSNRNRVLLSQKQHIRMVIKEC